MVKRKGEYHKKFHALHPYIVLTNQNHIFLPFHNTSQYSQALDHDVLHYLNVNIIHLNKQTLVNFLFRFMLISFSFAYTDINFLKDIFLRVNKHFQCHQNTNRA
jgi:hypothetical protein